jgi:hypothetical protein
MKMRKRTDENSTLKKLVEDFDTAHKTYCGSIAQASYRLTKDAAQIGSLVRHIQKEGGFKTKRRLWVWLELELGYEIPKTTFYRYINAAEWWEQAEIVHGQEALTDVASLKALKLLASPRVEFDPIDDGWTKKGSNYTRTIQGVHAEVRCDEGKKPYVWINGKCDCATGGLREAITIAEEKAARLAQVPPQANGAAQVLKHPAAVEAQDAVIENADNSDPNDEDDEEQNPQETAQVPTTKPQQVPQVPTNGTSAWPTVNGTPQQITYFHHDCHNFEIDGNSLQCLDQQSQTVILVASKQQRMADLLKDALGDKPEDPQIKERIDQSKQSGQEATEKKPKGVKSKKPKKMPNQNHMNGRRNRK